MAPVRDLTVEALALVVAEEAARAKALAQAIALVLRAVRRFEGWYDTAEITKWADDITKGIEPIQRLLARTTDAYLARTATLISGRRVRPVGAIDVSALRTGVTHQGAYGRVADVYRYQESRTRQPERVRVLQDPIDAAIERAEAVATIDMQQAVQHQSRKFMAAQPKLTGYRRIIHPELSKSGTCGLCIAASDRLYGPTELMPIHDRCKCLPLPVYGSNDPGSALNEGDLERLYKEGGGTSAEKLKGTRYKITDHGELGPLLTREGAEVRTAADAKRDERS